MPTDEAHPKDGRNLDHGKEQLEQRECQPPHAANADTPALSGLQSYPRTGKPTIGQLP